MGRDALAAYQQWTSSHWIWVLGAVILCLAIIAGFFLTASASQEAEDETD